MSRSASRFCCAAVFAVFALLAAIGAGAVAAQPQMRVLLVAVTGYNHGDAALQDAPDLDTVPDVTALQQVLEQHFQIPAGDITILQTPAETTHAAIKAAFYKYLVDATQPGDTVYFHYSGHGAQTQDPNDPTRWDQTLVPSDYLPNSAANDISNHEINGWLRDLAARKPGNVLLTFDCCHSGVITRGILTKVREYVRKTSATRTLVSDQAPAAAPVPGSGDVTGLLATGASLGYTVISACRNDQLDSETDSGSGEMGSLSFALARAFDETDATTTYGDLMQRITTIMQEQGLDQQEPQMEGSLDNVIFSASVIHPQPAITVDYDTTGTAKIMAGTLMGIAPQTKIAIYAHGTHEFDGATPIATGVVDVTYPTYSSLVKPVAMSAGHSLQELHDALALITARHYTDTPLTVACAAPADASERGILQAALAPLVAENMVALASAGAKPDLTITTPPPGAKNNGQALAVQAGAGAGGICVQRQDGSFLTFFVPGTPSGTTPYFQALSTSDAQWAATVAKGITREVKRRTLNALPAQNSGGPDQPYGVDIRVIPCEVGPKINPATNQTRMMWLRDVQDPAQAGAHPAFAVGDHFRVELQNAGQQTAYVTLLDIEDDGAIDAVWPEMQGTTYNALVANSGWQPINDPQTGTYKTWRVTDPIGNETLFAIATQDKTDFGPLLDPDPTRGVDRGVGDSPLASLLRAAALGTRAEPDDQPIGAWGAFPYSLTVTPAAK